MPIAYRIDHERRLVIARGYGIFSGDDIFAYQADVWSIPKVQSYDELVDMSLVTDISTSSAEQMRRLAVISTKADDPVRKSKFAIAAPSDLAFGLGRMYATFRHTQGDSTKHVGVFRTLAEALEFLGIRDSITLPEVGS
jgi:hypothetical protein